MDTSGQSGDRERVWNLTIEATEDGVSMSEGACTRQGRADLHPTGGQEELYRCDFGVQPRMVLALRSADGGLLWAGRDGERLADVELGDVTGDGRAEAILSGRFEIDPTMGLAWKLEVVTFGEDDAETIFEYDDGDALFEHGPGADPQHELSVRAAAGDRPPALVHVETVMGDRTEHVLVYDADAGELRPE